VAAAAAVAVVVVAAATVQTLSQKTKLPNSYHRLVSQNINHHLQASGV
jgi:hypothetical protein